MSGLRFVLVAAGGFSLQMVVLQVLTSGANMSVPLAVAIAVESAILHNFFWHERWTFGDRGAARAGRLGRLVRFNGATAIISVLGNVAITTAVLAWVSVPVAVASAVAVALLGVLNYFLADRWVWEGVRS